jgi:hypothetical protein
LRIVLEAIDDSARFPLEGKLRQPDRICRGVQRFGKSKIVRDCTGSALGYFYIEEEPGRCSAPKLLTSDELRRMAVNLAK